MTTPDRAQIEGFHDPATGSISYIVLDRETQRCALIDTVTEYDSRSGRTNHALADRLIARVKELHATVEWILETHVHADHLSAAPYLKHALSGQLGIGEHIATVQGVFARLFNAGQDFHPDGRQFDHLFRDGEHFRIGNLEARAMHTPGHTPACMTYLILGATGATNAAFVGDTLFMPDYGTARCDFPGGDARTLYRSIKKVLELPSNTLLYMCHDYQPGGRKPVYVSTVLEERKHNIHIHDGIGEEEFVTMRQTRDAALGMPALMLPSVQVNMRAGELPEPEKNGTRYLKIPLNAI
jgi:glyoxylase-like metal-dependent hydrolase (beta-lactamase superfamily II)